MHRLAVTMIALASALSVSRIAHADLYCPDYLSGGYTPDELTSVASQTLANDLRACVCYADCSAACMTYEPVEGNYACGIGNDPAFASQGGDQAACDSCIAIACGELSLACWIDGS